MKKFVTIVMLILVIFTAGCSYSPIQVELSGKSIKFIENYNKEEIEEVLENKKEYINEVYSLTQKYRKENKQKILEFDEALTAIAMVRAQEIAESEKFSHHRPNKEYFSSLYKEYGFTEGDVGENLAKEFATPAETLEAWKNSETHNANMLQGKWTKIGIGFAEKKDGTKIWVQEFM